MRISVGFRYSTCIAGPGKLAIGDQRIVSCHTATCKYCPLTRSSAVRNQIISLHHFWSLVTEHTAYSSSNRAHGYPPAASDLERRDYPPPL